MDEFDTTPSTEETPDMETPAEETTETPADDTEVAAEGEDTMEGESTL